MEIIRNSIKVINKHYLFAGMQFYSRVVQCNCNWHSLTHSPARSLARKYAWLDSTHVHDTELS